ncbi:MAG: diacylglycerol kinase family protein [Anaerolineae bacterium]|nr:diacylglycerol kinase family protein [Anaerolineae bacterium]
MQGWGHVLRTQRNAWIHAAISCLVLLVGFYLKLPAQDWAAIVLTLALVWAAESFNTALEALTDLISPNQNHLAKITKDVGAGAVLICAVAAVVVGFLILGPPLWVKLQPFF